MFTTVAGFLVMAMAAGAPKVRVLRGVIMDEAMRPIAEAQIEMAGTLISARSRQDGSFQLVGLPDSLRLIVRHIGFTAFSASVVFGSDSEKVVNIAMVSAPLQLSGVVVPGERSEAFAQTVTRESVRHLPALGEPDVLRVLPFLAGVSQPNDMLSVTYLSGAAADETSYSIDGHPLQSATHLSGMFSGLNVAAIERADVLMHHVPATLDSRLGGIVRLTTRQTSATPDREAVVSLLSSGVTVSQPHLWKDAALLGSARLTYMDWLVERLGLSQSGGEDMHVPHYFDGLVRMQVPIGVGFRVEPILFITQDARNPGSGAPLGTQPIVLREYLAGGRVIDERGSWTNELRFSRDEYSVADGTIDGSGSPRTDIAQLHHSAAANTAGGVGSLHISAAISADMRSHHDQWTAAKNPSVVPVTLPATMSLAQTQTLFGVGAEAAALLRKSLTATIGGRLSAIGGQSFLAPRATLTMEASPTLSVVVAADRRYQFDGEIGTREDATMATPMFLFDSPRRLDGVASTIQIKLPQGSDRLTALEISVYGRRISNRPVSIDSALGPSGALQFSRVDGRTAGISNAFSVATSNGFSLQATYTFQRTLQQDGRTWRRASWDVPHSFALFSALPVGRLWSTTVALQMHSGIPATPVVTRVFVPSTGDPITLEPRLIYGEPNAARLPGFRRADAGVRRTWKRRSSEWSFTAQVVNILHSRNVFGYDWQAYVNSISAGSTNPQPQREGLPIVPSIGLEIRW